MFSRIFSSATATMPPPVARAAPIARSPWDGSPTASDATPVAASTREMPRSSANAAAIGLEPRAWAANRRGTGSAARRARVSSAKPWASFANSVPLAAGQTTASGQLPAELLGDLERDRLRALTRIRMEIAADEAPWEEAAELELQPAAVVIGARDREDARAGVPRRDGRRFASDGREHDRLQPGRRCGGADGVAEIARRRAAQRGHAVVQRGRRRDRRDAVLVGVGRVVTFELQVEIDSEQVGEPVGAAERRPPGAVLDACAGREQALVPPERLRAAGDRVGS